MELKLIRTKQVLHLPLDPEDKTSRTAAVQKGLVALVPDDFKLSEESYDLIQKVSSVKKKK